MSGSAGGTWISAASQTRSVHATGARTLSGFGIPSGTSPLQAESEGRSLSAFPGMVLPVVVSEAQYEGPGTSSSQ